MEIQIPDEEISPIFGVNGTDYNSPKFSSFKGSPDFNKEEKTDEKTDEISPLFKVQVHKIPPQKEVQDNYTQSS